MSSISTRICTRSNLFKRESPANFPKSEIFAAELGEMVLQAGHTTVEFICGNPRKGMQVHNGDAKVWKVMCR